MLRPLHHSLQRCSSGKRQRVPADAGRASAAILRSLGRKPAAPPAVVVCKFVSKALWACKGSHLPVHGDKLPFNRYECTWTRARPAGKKSIQRHHRAPIHVGELLEIYGMPATYETRIPVQMASCKGAQRACWRQQL